MGGDGLAEVIHCLLEVGHATLLEVFTLVGDLIFTYILQRNICKEVSLYDYVMIAS